MRRRDRSSNGEVVEVDHVQIGAHANLDRAAIVEPVEPCVAAGLLLDQRFQRNSLTPGTVAVGVEQDEIVVHALTREAAEGLQTGEMDRRVTDFEGRG